MATAEQYERIDPIKSIKEMRKDLEALPEEERRAVILHALQHSEYQFTWSAFAKDYSIPQSCWPDKL